MLKSFAALLGQLIGKHFFPPSIGGVDFKPTPTVPLKMTTTLGGILREDSVPAPQPAILDFYMPSSCAQVQTAATLDVDVRPSFRA